MHTSARQMGMSVLILERFYSKLKAIGAAQQFNPQPLAFTQGDKNEKSTAYDTSSTDDDDVNSASACE